MSGRNKRRQHRIAENNVPAVASVEQLDELVFEIGCKMREPQATAVELAQLGEEDC